MGLLHDQTVIFPDDQLGLQSGQVEAERPHEPDIQHFLAQRFDLFGGLELTQRQLKLAVMRPALCQQFRQERVQRQLIAADRKPSAPAGGQVVQPLPREFRAPQDRFGLLQEELARRSQLHRPAGPFEKFRFQLLFQFADRGAQRRLRHVQLRRRPMEMQFLADRHKVAQRGQFH